MRYVGCNLRMNAFVQVPGVLAQAAFALAAGARVDVAVVSLWVSA